MAAQPAKWVSNVRGAIKHQHGFGWSIREVAGKVQLTRRFEDGSRSSVVLDLPWNPDCTGTLLGLLPEIRHRMEGQQLGLKEAYGLLRGPVAPHYGRLDWGELVSRFEKNKVADAGDVKQATWDANYRPVMAKVLELMASRPVPRDSRALLAGLRDRYGGEPGSRGRKLRIQYAAQLLRFSVVTLGAPDRWLPPDDLVPFVGRAATSVEREGATPLKHGQFIRLLEGIPDQRWRLAVGLAGCRYNWRERALAWDRAEAAAGRCPPPPVPPKAREPIRRQKPPQALACPPPDAPPDPLGSMGREWALEHQAQEARDYIQVMRKIGRSFVRESEQSLELLHLMQDTFRLEIERYRQLIQENQYQTAADMNKAANSTAFMIVRFSSTATSLAAAGRQHWGDAAGLLEVLRKVYGV